MPERAGVGLEHQSLLFMRPGDGSMDWNGARAFGSTKLEHVPLGAYEVALLLPETGSYGTARVIAPRAGRYEVPVQVTDGRWVEGHLQGSWRREGDPISVRYEGPSPSPGLARHWFQGWVDADGDFRLLCPAEDELTLVVHRGEELLARASGIDPARPVVIALE